MTQKKATDGVEVKGDVSSSPRGGNGERKRPIKNATDGVGEKG